MNKTDFLAELRHKLRHLPPDEIDNACSYYEEYLNDAARSQNEAQAIMELGRPSSVAAKIIGEYAITDAKIVKKKDSNPLFIVILAVFASPIALPLAIAVILVIFSIFMVFVALEISGAAVAIAGVVCIFSSFWIITIDFATGIFILGMGLFTLAIGAAILIVITKIMRTTFRGLQGWLGRLLVRRGSK